MACWSPTDQIVSAAELVQPEHDGRREGGRSGPARSRDCRPTRMPSPLRNSVSSEPGHQLANSEMRDVSPPASAQYGGSKHWIWSSRSDPERLGD